MVKINNLLQIQNKKTKPENKLNKIEIYQDQSEILRVQSVKQQILSSKGLPLEWGIVGCVFEDEYINIFRDAVRFPDGKDGTYIRIVHKHPEKKGVAVIPFFDEKIVLIRHFRHATQQQHWEIPRGFGSSLIPEETVITEIHEEIGGKIICVESLGSMYPDSGLMSEEVLLYKVTLETYEESEYHEPISDISLFSKEEIMRMIFNNEITDSFTLAAFLKTLLNTLEKHE